VAFAAASTAITLRLNYKCRHVSYVNGSQLRNIYCLKPLPKRMEELQRMEELLASGSIQELPVQHMEQLLMQELLASTAVLVRFLKATPARLQWLQLRAMLRGAMRLQAHCRTACVRGSIGAVITQRATVALANAGTALAEAYLQNSETRGHNVEPQRRLVFTPPPCSRAEPRSTAPPPLPRAPSTSGVASSAAIRNRQVMQPHAASNAPATASAKYTMPSGNRHQPLLPANESIESPARHGAPYQAPASPTLLMMQRARAARTKMPVYNSPPILASHAVPSTDSSILFAPTAAALMSKSAHQHALSPVHASEQHSPSVIWVNPSDMHSPSGAAVAPSSAVSAVTHDSWPQLRVMLEASLQRQDGALAGGAQGATVHSVLETEIALMQVLLQCAAQLLTVTLCDARAGLAEGKGGCGGAAAAAAAGGAVPSRQGNGAAAG
jgi:hypothetical protein